MEFLYFNGYGGYIWASVLAFVLSLSGLFYRELRKKSRLSKEREQLEENI